MSTPTTMHVLAMRDDRCWVAQCLEHDLATQASTLDELQSEVIRLLIAHIASAEELGVEPFADVPPAPREYWEKYSRTISQLQPLTTSWPRLATRHEPPIPEIKVAA